MRLVLIILLLAVVSAHYPNQCPTLKLEPLQHIRCNQNSFNDECYTTYMVLLNEGECRFHAILERSLHERVTYELFKKRIDDAYDMMIKAENDMNDPDCPDLCYFKSCV